MKVVFWDDQESSEHETEAEEVAQLFGLAENLAEKDLAKLEKVVENFRPETMKSNP